MRVIGTAGHVDHGKSTLIKAISGIDPDRLREEKERGMTIDLGFAWITMPSGESVGIVDVPGHIDFIKNMLAGVGSVDAALFVVAADEGIMPQTHEHLDILDLLEVSTGVVAITKSDLAEDEEWLELVHEEVIDTFANTALGNAPIVPVSATTGAGIPELLATLDNILRQTPPRPDKGRPRLFVDRIFSISGFGTVVTGTLIDGYFSRGQEVEILPSGLKSRIRGLQSHKKKVEQVGPGMRVAINLTGLSTSDLHRGDVITLPGWLEPSQLIDVRLRCLDTAARPLKHNQSVDIFTGSTEASGHLRLLGTREIAPGEEGWVQLRLARRIPVVKGDRFIVRQPSPSLTVAGGVVVDPLPRRRHRRFRPELLKRLATLAHGTPEDLLLETLDRLGPVQVRALVTQSTLAIGPLETALQSLLKSGDVFQLPRLDAPKAITNLKVSKALIASKVGWRNLVERYRAVLSAYHQANPMRMGMPRGELMSRLKLETGLFNKTIQQAVNIGLIQATEITVWLSEHTPTFTPAQQQAMDALLQRFIKNPYGTPSYKESLAALGNNEEALYAMIEGGSLLRLSPDVLFLSETFAQFVAWLNAYIAQNGGVTLAQVRDVFKTSRKYALALLEYTDAQGITKRVGDERVLR
ncbi:MAG TPA: selenocysteine-specific translation elongation factor [Chloroflexi bacterium]|nr:selenocysteine-specific translation elongation factor [Chloroflexota bacterium]